MRSSWTCCVASSCLLIAVLALAATPPATAKARDRSPEELTNFLLGPEYSQWLVGAVSRIADEDEIEAYLELTDDAAAAEFIEAFWRRRRSPEAVWPSEQPQALYETRAATADRLYSEGARLGRRTDRGSIYVLYGEPAEIDYTVGERRGPREPQQIEVWEYPKDAPEGLDGEEPKRFYYFAERGGATVLVPPPPLRRRLPGAG